LTNFEDALANDMKKNPDLFDQLTALEKKIASRHTLMQLLGNFIL
jgi:hypothetical protein